MIIFKIIDCTYLFVFVCVCICAHVHVCVHMQAELWTCLLDQKTPSEAICFSFLGLFVCRLSLSWNLLIGLNWLALSPKDPLISTSPSSWNHKDIPLYPALLWAGNSGSHVCIESTSPNNYTPSPCLRCFIHLATQQACEGHHGHKQGHSVTKWEQSSASLLCRGTATV